MTSLTGTEVVPGQVLAGKYRIDRVLGRGGMGIVVQATHIQLDERVALKFLLPEALANPEAVHRFEREARAAVKIKSEHVARVIDVGTLETGSPYMVMEYLSGVDLAQYLERGGTLSVSEAVDYVVQAMEAIAEAHALGIVHRDLKPANLFRIVRSDGTPSIKVLDFGISKVGGDHSMTQTSSMMGSPYYMSPEQMMSSKSVDARTDIWSLGVILYELIAGKVPFDGEAIPEIVAKVLQNSVPAIDTRADIPPGFQKVLEKALAKERADRFNDVAGLAAALLPFASPEARVSVQRVSRVLGVAAAEITLPDGAAQAASTDPERVAPASVTTFGGAATTNLDLPAGVPASGRGLLYAGLAAALVALAGAGVFALSAGPRTNRDEGLIATPSSSPPDTPPRAAASESTPSTEPSAADPKQPSEDPPMEASAAAPDAAAPGDATPTAAPSTKQPVLGAKAPAPPASPPAKGASKSPATPAPRTPAAGTVSSSKPPVTASPAAPPRTSPKPPSDLFSDRK